MNKTRLLFWLIVGVLLSSCNLPVPGFIQETPTPTVVVQPLRPKIIPSPLPPPTPTTQPTPVPVEGILKGNRSLLEGDWTTAQQAYKSALDSAADDSAKSSAMLGLGHTSYLLGNYAEALNYLRPVLDIPNTADKPRAYFFLAQTYTQLQRYPEAAEAYQNYLKHRPGILEAYVHEYRADTLLRGGDTAGALSEYQSALKANRAGDRLALDIKLANAYLRSGDYNTAIVMYDDIHDRAGDDVYTKAQMRLLKGRALLQQGQKDKAIESFQNAVETYPQAYDSYTALVELVNAEVTINDLSRGMVDYYAGEYGAAFAALERYILSKTGDASTIAAAYYFRGLALQGRGEYASAIKEWDILIEKYPKSTYYPNAWDEKGYTLWNFMEQYPQAVETFLAFVKKNPQDVRAPEFLVNAARVAERSGDLEQAARLWERVAVEYPTYDGAFRSTFLGAIMQYRLAKYKESLSDLQRALGLTTKMDERAMVLLWTGKAQQVIGDKEAARINWQQASISDPTGYYSERARQLLTNDRNLFLNPFSPPPAYDLDKNIQKERIGAELWLKSTFKLDEDTNLSGVGPLLDDERLWRGTELWGLGLFPEAEDEFVSLQVSLKDDPANTFRLANYMFDLGAYRMAIISSRQVLDAAKMDDIATLSAPVYFNRLRFGSYYRSLFTAAADEYQFNPLFLFSIARQESMFQGFGRSHAGARGLMQIIPSTGDNITTQLDWPSNYKEDDLYRPNVSVKFGAFYLAKMRDMFKGDLYAALAAYNGGPGNTAIWRELAPDDPDLFLESIRFEETRNYIRGIFEIFTIYNQLYARAE